MMRNAYSTLLSSILLYILSPYSDAFTGVFLFIPYRMIRALSTPHTMFRAVYTNVCECLHVYCVMCIASDKNQI